MLTIPCGSRAQTSATASPRSTGSPSSRRYEPAASVVALTAPRAGDAPATSPADSYRAPAVPQAAGWR
jgi:hypothetical protein